MGHSRKANFYVADFETTGSNATGMRVWLWGLTNRKRTNFKWGENLESFINEISNLKDKRPLIYFHNLRFDGSYILVYLLNKGYYHVDKIEGDKQISSVITDTGLFYDISFSINGKVITFHDSFKKVPISLAQMPRAYGLDIEKLDMDYSEKPFDYKPTQEDIDYQRNDVYIPAEVLDIQYSEGLTKMTSSADALEDYKNTIGKRQFKKRFPVLPVEVDTFIRKSYKGGITYAKEATRGKKLGEGVVYDIHSMYPGMMKNHILPYGKPIYFEGDVQDWLLEEYPLYVVRVIADFELLPDHMPSIQIKGDIRFPSNEYIKKSDGEVELYLTSVDYEVFKKQHHFYYLEVKGAYYFKGATGFFDKFIDYWYTIKESEKSDVSMVTLAKLKLNGLYGKFGSNPKNSLKKPYLENGVLRFKTVEQEDRESIYVPMASFITSYARKEIVETAQKLWKYFNYCDTDSVHLTGIPNHVDLNDYIEITDNEIGTWGLETYFDRAVFYRAKTYKEEINGEVDIKCAGLSGKTLESVPFDEFEVGVVFEHLKSRQIKGGVELYTAPFVIK